VAGGLPTAYAFLRLAAIAATSDGRSVKLQGCISLDSPAGRQAGLFRFLIKNKMKAKPTMRKIRLKIKA